MTIQEVYDKLHGNYEDAKARLMSDTLISRFILKFPADPSMPSLREQIDLGNLAEAFRAVHTLKGVAANLGFTQLQMDASNLTEQMRDCISAPDPELLDKLEDTYNLVISVLQEYEKGF